MSNRRHYASKEHPSLTYCGRAIGCAIGSRLIVPETAVADKVEDVTCRSCLTWAKYKGVAVPHQKMPSEPPFWEE